MGSMKWHRCGAPLSGNKCSFCGKVFKNSWDANDISAWIRDRQNKKPEERLTPEDYAKLSKMIDRDFLVWVTKMIVIGLLAVLAIFTLVKYGHQMGTGLCNLLWRVPAFAKWQRFFADGTRHIAVMGMISTGGVFVGALGTIAAILGSLVGKKYDIELWGSSLMLMIGSYATSLLIISVC